MKRQENMVPSKEQDQSPENDATKMETFKLSDKEFKISVENSLVIQGLGLSNFTSGPLVQSLVWELGSHKPHGTAKKKEKKPGSLWCSLEGRGHTGGLGSQLQCWPISGPPPRRALYPRFLSSHLLTLPPAVHREFHSYVLTGFL